MKREDEHTVEDVIGSDSVIQNKDDGNDAAYAHIQEEQLPVSAEDCCAESKSDVQHTPRPVKTPTETEIISSIPEKNVIEHRQADQGCTRSSGERRKPSNEDASHQEENLKRKKCYNSL
jgi:hypothetical protein